MNRIKKIAAMLVVALGATTASFAQEIDHEGGYNFIGIKGGTQATLTHYSMSDLITPQYGIYFGRYFNQFVGARLDVTGYKNKGGFKADRYEFVNADTPYKFNAATADIDLLMNMSNILNPNRASHAWNWNLIVGFGVNYTWEHDDFNAVKNSFKYYVGPETCGTKHASFNGRLGTQLEYNVTDKFSVMLEADANYKNDQYNLKFNDHNDWQIQAFVGLAYKFGYKTKKVVKEEPAPVVKEEPKPVVKETPKPVVREEPKPVVKKDEPLKETVFYAIRVSDPDVDDVINKVVEWCNKYPNKGIVVSGYADKGTGNARVNRGYAKKRAEKIAKVLQERGIDASRMTVNSFGDTVQPFDDNDQNRCVIIIGE